MALAGMFNSPSWEGDFCEKAQTAPSVTRVAATHTYLDSLSTFVMLAIPRLGSPTFAVCEVAFAMVLA